MNFARIFSMSIICLVTISGCKKVVVDTTSALEKLTNGTAKTWKYIESKTDGKNDLGDCNNDDLLIFNALTSKLNINRGAIRCYGNEADQETDFGFKENNTILTIDDESYSILNFTKTTLKLKSIPGLHADGEVHDHKNEITLGAIN